MHVDINSTFRNQASIKKTIRKSNLHLQHTSNDFLFFAAASKTTFFYYDDVTFKVHRKTNIKTCTKVIDSRRGGSQTNLWWTWRREVNQRKLFDNFWQFFIFPWLVSRIIKRKTFLLAIFHFLLFIFPIFACSKKTNFHKMQQILENFLFKCIKVMELISGACWRKRIIFVPKLNAKLN